MKNPLVFRSQLTLAGLLAGWLTACGAEAPLRLLNLNFGVDATPARFGPAATGVGDSDIWNLYSRDDGQGGYRSFGGLVNLKWSDGESSGVDVSVANAPGAWGNEYPDSMFGVYLYPFDAQPIVMTFTHLPAGTYSVYAYGHGGPPDVQNTAFELHSAGGSYGLKRTTTRSDWRSAQWVEGWQFVRYTNVAVISGKPMVLISRPDAIPQAVVNGLQLRLESTNVPSEPPPFELPVIEPPPPPPPPVDPAVRSVRAPRKVVDRPSSLLNVQFGTDASGEKTGGAAIGESLDDFWNLYSRDNGRGGFRQSGTLSPVYWANGAMAPVSIDVENAPGAWPNGLKDPMMGLYLYPLGGGPDVSLTVRDLPAGRYTILAYGHGGPPAEQNTVFELNAAGVDYGRRATSDKPEWAEVDWVEGRQYVGFTGVLVAGGEPVVIRARPGSGGLGFINGLQLRLDGDSTQVSMTPGSGLFTNAIQVRLLGGRAGDEIRYTIDGSLPAMTSPVYKGPITLTAAAVVKAQLFRGGEAVSEPVASTYRRVYAVAGDGIPAEWRQSYFGADFLTDPRAAADADPDGDGADNRSEYAQGSNPVDPASGFIVRTRLVPSISWKSEPGKRYRILRKDGAASTEWIPVTEVLATGPFSRFTDEDAIGGDSYYTVRPIDPALPGPNP